MFKNAKYVEWRNTVPPAFSNQQPFSLKIPVDRNWDTAKRRILFVLEHVDTEDLRSQYKRLMTGPSNSWVESAIDLGLDYAKHTDPQRAAYAAINFNFFKTYDLMGADQIAANEMAAARVQAYARKMKATDVVVFGDIAAAACMAHAVKDERTLLLRRGRPIEIDGVWWTNTISLSLAYQGKADTSEDGEEEEAESKIDHANLLGFVSRCIGNAMHRGIVYQFDAKPKIKFINDIASFKRLYKRMMECDRAAVDTETTSLGRVVNRVLTIQIAFDDKVSYVVPLDHKDAAWSPKEKRMVEKGFRNFFARKFDPLSKRYDQYLLGQNLKFDMTILRQRFHIHMITWRVWDMMAGEYCFDPDTLVETEFGMRKIIDIVRDPNPPRVWSFNHTTGERELKHVLYQSEHMTTDRMMELEYEGGTLRVTENHEIWSVTRNCYIKVKDVREDEEVLIQP